MRLFRFLKPVSSAPVARERLQILLEYERRMVSQSSLITTLKDEILAVVSRHVSIDPEKIHVSVDRGNGFSTLAVGVQIPNQVASEAGMPQAGVAGQSPATPT
jgi:cell division topological specificity factor